MKTLYERFYETLCGFLPTEHAQTAARECVDAFNSWQAERMAQPPINGELPPECWSTSANSDVRMNGAALRG